MSYQNRSRSNSTSANRGRSSSRSRSNPIRGGRLGFFSRNVRQEEEKKLSEVKDDVEDLSRVVADAKQKLSEPTPSNARLKSKINENVEKGKEFISKFFRGFIQPERGNVKVELNSHVTNRLTEPYLERITTYAQREYPSLPDKSVDFYHKFKGMVNISMAIKLFKSSTEFDKNLNNRLSSIRNVDVPMPKKLNVLLNQIGKTDLLNDNRIRIANQHLLVKRYMLRGATWFLGDTMDQYLENHNKKDDVLKVVESSKYFERIIDETMGSVQMIKNIGRECFLTYSERNYTFKMQDKLFVFRLPAFDFKDNLKVDDIVEYFKSSVFSSFDWDPDVVGKVIASLVFQVVKFPWLKQRHKTMGELESKFANTLVANYCFQDILDFSNISFINQYINEDTLDDVVNDVLHKWKTGDSRYFNQMFEMDEFKFSEFGTDAQLIEIKQFDKEDKNELDERTYKIIDRQPVQSVLKTTESGAIIGLSVAYSKNVSFSSKFLVQHDSKNSQILREFIKSDFKT